MKFMKLTIDPNAVLNGEISLQRFGETLKETGLDIKKAIEESTLIRDNLIGWDDEYVRNVLLAEIDWTAILMNFKWKKSATMFFKVCPIKFEGKIEYEKYTRDSDYSEIVLKSVIKNGKGYIIINSFNSNPDHNIDIWIAKSTFPYPKSEWKNEKK